MAAYLPKVLLIVSAIIIAVGTLVLTYGTAPRLFRVDTNEQSWTAGSFAQPTNPTELVFPAVSKLSFSEMGTPWNGPRSFPVRLSSSSRDLAVAMASENNVSVKQFVWP